MKKIRWGIAGPGNIANKFAQAIKNVLNAGPGETYINTTHSIVNGQ